MNFLEFFTTNAHIYQALLSFLPFIPLIKWRKGWQFELIPSLVLVIVVSYFLYGRLTSGSLFLCSLYYALVFLITTLLVEISAEGGWMNAFFISSSAFVFRYLSSSLFNIASISFAFLKIEGAVADFIIYSVIVSVSYVALYYAYVKRIKDYGSSAPKNPALIAITLISFLIIVPLNEYFGRLFEASGDRTAQILFGTVSVILCVGLLFSLYFIARNDRYSEDLKALRELLEVEKKQYQTFQQSLETLNIKYHDLKYKVNEAKKNAAESDEWINEANDALDSLGSVKKTGNNALDVVLAEKSFQCRAMEIEFDCLSVDGTVLSAMSDTDIFAVFGNALDNAIECLQKVPKEKRSLRISIGRVGNMAKAQIENYSENEIELKNGFPKTSKKIEGTHGFGVKSIAGTMKKYNGIVHYAIEDKTFIMMIVLPCSKQ